MLLLFSNRSSLLHLIILRVLHSRIHQSPDCIKKGLANLWGDQLSLCLRVHSLCSFACGHTMEIQRYLLQSLFSFMFMLFYILGMQLILLSRHDTETNITILVGGGYCFLFTRVCNCYGFAYLLLVREQILKTLLNKISMISLGKSDKRNSY